MPAKTRTTGARYKVTHDDNVLRWKVASATRPDILHVVDLADFEGHGACSCENFDFRLRPLLEQGNPEQRPTRCSHILAAREAFATAMISRLLEAIDK